MSEPEQFRPRSYSSPVQQVQMNDSLNQDDHDSQDDGSSLDFELMDNNPTLDVNDLYLFESIVNNNNICHAQFSSNQYSILNEFNTNQNCFSLQNDSVSYSY